MTSLDRNGVTVSSIGPQAQSARITAPSYSLAKSGRAQRENVYITEAHIRTARLGRESPAGALIGAEKTLVGGGVYELPSTLDLAGRGFSFGTSQRIDICHTKLDDLQATDSDNALMPEPDSQPFKYRRDPEHLIGTQPRGQLKDATLLENHAVAFYGRCSPGPGANGGDYGPNFKPTKKNLAPARSFRPKLENQMRWQKTCDTPHEVGPGTYSRRDHSFGQQYLTQRRNQDVHKFPGAAKFPKTRNADQISMLDAARSSVGKQRLSNNRSEPSINFNCDTRGSRERTRCCITKLDEGPKAHMPKMCLSMPSLPSEAVIMRSHVG